MSRSLLVGCLLAAGFALAGCARETPIAPEIAASDQTRPAPVWAPVPAQKPDGTPRVSARSGASTGDSATAQDTEDGRASEPIRPDLPDVPNRPDDLKDEGDRSDPEPYEIDLEEALENGE